MWGILNSRIRAKDAWKTDEGTPLIPVTQLFCFLCNNFSMIWPWQIRVLNNSLNFLSGFFSFFLLLLSYLSSALLFCSFWYLQYFRICFLLVIWMAMLFYFPANSLMARQVEYIMFVRNKSGLCFVELGKYWSVDIMLAFPDTRPQLNKQKFYQYSLFAFHWLTFKRWNSSGKSLMNVAISLFLSLVWIFGLWWLNTILSCTCELKLQKFY